MTYQEHIQTLQNEIDTLLQEMWNISKNPKSGKSLPNYHYMTEIEKKINVLRALQNQYLQILNPNYRHYCTPISVPRHIKYRAYTWSKQTTINIMNDLYETLNRKFTAFIPNLTFNSKIHSLNYMPDENAYIRAQDLYMTQFN